MQDAQVVAAESDDDESLADDAAVAELESDSQPAVDQQAQVVDVVTELDVPVQRQAVRPRRIQKGADDALIKKNVAVEQQHLIVADGGPRQPERSSDGANLSHRDGICASRNIHRPAACLPAR